MEELQLISTITEAITLCNNHSNMLDKIAVADTINGSINSTDDKLPDSIQEIISQIIFSLLKCNPNLAKTLIDTLHCSTDLNSDFYEHLTIKLATIKDVLSQ